MEAVRLNPEDAGARLNLGVGLARQRRFREAIEHFEAVLRMEPGNEAARQYLALAKSQLQGAAR